MEQMAGTPRRRLKIMALPAPSVGQGEVVKPGLRKKKGVGKGVFKSKVFSLSVLP